MKKFVIFSFLGMNTENEYQILQKRVFICIKINSMMPVCLYVFDCAKLADIVFL